MAIENTPKQPGPDPVRHVTTTATQGSEAKYTYGGSTPQKQARMWIRARLTRGM